MIYAAAYALCFGVEGAMRLKYHVGSLTEIEQKYPDRGQRAKAMVAREKLLDARLHDPIYKAYLLIVWFGTPILTIYLLVHDIQFVNRLLWRWWKPFRWLVVGFVVMLGTGILLISASVGADHFYDRVSPAELLASRR